MEKQEISALVLELFKGRAEQAQIEYAMIQDAISSGKPK